LILFYGKEVATLFFSEVVSSIETLRLLFKIVVALDEFCHSSAKMEQVLFREYLLHDLF
jgi:hypothetical protein